VELLRRALEDVNKARLKPRYSLEGYFEIHNHVLMLR
jgi:hypothetical protein